MKKNPINNESQKSQPRVTAANFMLPRLVISSISCGQCPSRNQSEEIGPCNANSFSFSDLSLCFGGHTIPLPDLSCPRNEKLSLKGSEIPFWVGGKVTLKTGDGEIACTSADPISDLGPEDSVTLLCSGNCLCISYEVLTNPVILFVAAVREIITVAIKFLIRLIPSFISLPRFLRGLIRG